MLSLDAAEHAPTLWVVLTARNHLTRADCRRHLEQLRKALRVEWPDVQWFVQVEFQRRGALHLNLIVKGVDVRDVERFRSRIVGLWIHRPGVDATERAQWADVIDDGEGVVRYLQKTLSHGLKREQAPPLGWRGHRTSQTRGYLVRPASVMREEARRSLRVKRLIYAGLDAASAELEVAAAPEWSLRQVKQLGARGIDSDRGERLPRRFTGEGEVLAALKRDLGAYSVSVIPDHPKRRVC